MWQRPWSLNPSQHAHLGPRWVRDGLPMWAQYGFCPLAPSGSQVGQPRRGRDGSHMGPTYSPCGAMVGCYSFGPSPPLPRECKKYFIAIKNNLHNSRTVLAGHVHCGLTSGHVDRHRKAVHCASPDEDADAISGAASPHPAPISVMFSGEPPAHRTLHVLLRGGSSFFVVLHCPWKQHKGNIACSFKTA